MTQPPYTDGCLYFGTLLRHADQQVYHSVAFERAYDKAWRVGNTVAALHHVSYTTTVHKLEKNLKYS
jgi:hypothetical protein